MILSLIFLVTFLVPSVLLAWIFSRPSKSAKETLYSPEFTRWAFGEDFDPTTPLNKIPELWNYRHPYHKIHESDSLNDSAQWMLMLYQNRNK